MENIQPKISITDKKKMIKLRKKSLKKGTNNREPVSVDFFKTISKFIIKYPNIIFLYQIYNAMTLNKDSFYIYCREFDAYELLDNPIIDEIHMLLSINKASVSEQLRHDWLTDEKRTSSAERILLYKLCATRDELDIINNTYESGLQNNYEVPIPEYDYTKIQDYNESIAMLNKLDDEAGDGE